MRLITGDEVQNGDYVRLSSPLCDPNGRILVQKGEMLKVNGQSKMGGLMVPVEVNDATWWLLPGEWVPVSEN
jgi:hypothetical protein